MVLGSHPHQPGSHLPDLTMDSSFDDHVESHAFRIIHRFYKRYLTIIFAKCKLEPVFSSGLISWHTVYFSMVGNINHLLNLVDRVRLKTQWTEFQDDHFVSTCKGQGKFSVHPLCIAHTLKYCPSKKLKATFLLRTWHKN